MNDLWLFLGGLLFLFVLWIYSGGPNNPISFAGPYITPVSGPGVTQVGYGDSANKYYKTGGSGTSASTPSRNQSFWNTWSGSTGAAQTTFSNPSPYAGRIHIEGGQLNAQTPNDQYLLLHSDTNSAINISGWQLVSLKHQANETIPLGASALHRTGAAPISLPAGGEAVVTTGPSPFGISFAENKCIGYLSRSAAFTPPLAAYNCPAPLDELRASFAGSQSEFNACAQYVQNLPSCQTPNTDTAHLPASCQRFIDTNLNYDGCAANHHIDADFSGGSWRVYLGENRLVWGVSDSIMLQDANGKTVDVYSY